MFGQDRNQMREFFIQAWRKRRENQPLEPIEALIAGVVEQHPEYQRFLENPASTDQDFVPEMGQTNPFLHMGMHIALQEQLTTDRPPGVKAAYQALLVKLGEPHEVEHRMMECLGEALWEAQRSGAMPNDAKYLECLKGLV